jgi:hypothetical protein
VINRARLRLLPAKQHLLHLPSTVKVPIKAQLLQQHQHRVAQCVIQQSCGRHRQCLHSECKGQTSSNTTYTCAATSFKAQSAGSRTHPRTAHSMKRSRRQCNHKSAAKRKSLAVVQPCIIFSYSSPSCTQTYPNQTCIARLQAPPHAAFSCAMHIHTAENAAAKTTQVPPPSS